MTNDAAANRQKRLAQALRANLRKRKDQTRERSAEAASAPQESPTPDTQDKENTVHDDA